MIRACSINEALIEILLKSGAAVNETDRVR